MFCISRETRCIVIGHLGRPHRYKCTAVDWMHRFGALVHCRSSIRLVCSAISAWTGSRRFGNQNRTFCRRPDDGFPVSIAPTAKGLCSRARSGLETRFFVAIKVTGHCRSFFVVHHSCLLLLVDTFVFGISDFHAARSLTERYERQISNERRKDGASL